MRTLILVLVALICVSCTDKKEKNRKFDIKQNCKYSLHVSGHGKAFCKEMDENGNLLHCNVVQIYANGMTLRDVKIINPSNVFSECY